MTDIFCSVQLVTEILEHPGHPAAASLRAMCHYDDTFKTELQSFFVFFLGLCHFVIVDVLQIPKIKYERYRPRNKNTK